ncbi:hypothetical protein POM88_047916 [Heracleum sosnowskyi]|uniref:Uncharacterized protein n=1 Tax=Heracleum sosnowskyi TaxID=360622 RepID=A0AAD8LXZ5_9APIA|nr:hypothetical protein POM88_047916 [Heracleum sosnowskyi]
MGVSKSSVLFLMSVIILFHLTSFAKARTLSTSSSSTHNLLSVSSLSGTNTDTKSRGRYSKLVATLGLICKCCDGSSGEAECKTTWVQPCSNLQCHPWKQP